MKIPEPRKLKSGNYFIQLRLNGVSVPITAPTAKECKKMAQLVKAEHLAGKREIVKTDMTIGSLIDAYIAKYEPVLSPATIRGYASIRRNRFRPYMEKPYRDIKDWQTVVNDELKIVSAKTVLNGWGAVTASLGEAKLPVPEVTIPAIIEKDMPFLEPDEIPLFLDAAKGDSAEIEMLLELHGLRESEAMKVVLGNQFDLQHDLILVEGAVVQNKHQKFVEKDQNKTKASRREVPIMVPRLRELLLYHQKNGIPIKRHAANTILAHVHKTCCRAGITDVSNHGLRRTFASLGYSLGISERIIMDLGGWDDPNTVHKIYIKLAKRDKERARNAMHDFYRLKSDAEQLEDALAKISELKSAYGFLDQLKPVFDAAEKIKEAIT